MDYMIVGLSCRHELLFSEAAPFVGDVLWCVRCEAERRVTSAPQEARARCLGCTWSNGRHVNVSRAREAGRRHVEAHPAHRVRLYRGRDPIEELGAQRRALADVLEKISDDFGVSA